MNRLFGQKKEKVPVASLDETYKKIDGRVEDLDVKIKKYEDELTAMKKKMATMKPAAKNALKKRALDLLKKKKMLEQQRDALMSQSFNVQQTAFTLDNVKDSIQTAATMKEAAKSFKKEMKNINIDDIEDTMYELEDFTEEVNEMQEVMGRNAMMDDLDEDELDAELEALGDEFEDELDTQDYLSNLPNQVPNSVPVQEPVRENANHDEYGLPVANG